MTKYVCICNSEDVTIHGTADGAVRHALTMGPFASDTSKGRARRLVEENTSEATLWFKGGHVAVIYKAQEVG